MPQERSARFRSSNTTPFYWIQIKGTNEFFGPFRSRRKAGRFLYGNVSPSDKPAFDFWRANGMRPSNVRIRRMTFGDYVALGELIEADRRMGDLSP